MPTTWAKRGEEAYDPLDTPARVPTVVTFVPKTFVPSNESQLCYCIGITWGFHGSEDGQVRLFRMHHVLALLSQLCAGRPAMVQDCGEFERTLLEVVLNDIEPFESISAKLSQRPISSGGNSDVHTILLRLIARRLSGRLLNSRRASFCHRSRNQVWHHSKILVSNHN
jgi:hypothetical protein